MSDLSYQFLCPGDICTYTKLPGADDLSTEVMIVGSYAIVCHVHMRSRDMVQGGLDNRHFNKYCIMLPDNTTTAWIERDDLVFKERKGVEYFMRRMYRSQLMYDYVADSDIIGGLTAEMLENTIHNNYNTILFNPPDRDTIIPVTVKVLDKTNNRVVVEAEDGETYSDYPTGALYFDMTSSTKPIIRDCCDKHCIVGTESEL